MANRRLTLTNASIGHGCINVFFKISLRSNLVQRRHLYVKNALRCTYCLIFSLYGRRLKAPIAFKLVFVIEVWYMAVVSVRVNSRMGLVSKN